MEELAEREEIIDHMREHIDPEHIDGVVRSALEKAQYHINQWVAEDGSHTSIIHSGQTRSIITADEGTIIVEGLEEGMSKVIAIDSEDEVIFSGSVGADGSELNDTAPWVKEQFDKLANKRVKVIVDSEIIRTQEIEEDESDN